MAREEVSIEYDPPRDGFPGTFDVAIGNHTATGQSLDVALCELSAKLQEALYCHE